MATPLHQFEGKYEVLEKIAEGGMGAVYKVRHKLLDVIRVIKVMRPQIEAQEGTRARFLHEARTIALAVRLEHTLKTRVFNRHRQRALVEFCQTREVVGIVKVVAIHGQERFIDYGGALQDCVTGAKRLSGGNRLPRGTDISVLVFFERRIAAATDDGLGERLHGRFVAVGSGASCVCGGHGHA